MKRLRPAFVYLAFLAAVIAYGYWWSLFQPPRADHWWFLLNTLDDTELGEAIAGSYSYNRTRALDPGDTLLFRPLFYGLMGVQKIVLKTHYMLYQASSVFLHFLICVVVFMILSEIRRGALRESVSGQEVKPGARAMDRALLVLSGVIPLWLGINVVVSEAVMWTHLFGYLLYYLLILFAVYLGLCSLRGTNRPRTDSRLVAGAWCAVFLSAFVYETGHMYAVLLGAWLALARGGEVRRSRRWGQFAAFCIIPVIFYAANYADLRTHAKAMDRDVERGKILGGISTGAISWNTWDMTYRYSKHALVTPYMPLEPEIGLDGERVKLEEVDFVDLLRSGGPVAQMLLVSFAAWAVYLLGCALLTGTSRDRRLQGFSVLLVLFLGVQIALTVFGRLLTRIIAYMQYSTYGLYWPFILLLLIGFALSASGLMRTSKISPRIARVHVVIVYMIAAWLTVLSAMSVGRLQDLGQEIARQYDSDWKRIAQVNDFIAEHRHEKDFSVAFDVDRGDPVRYPHNLGVPMTTILYREYENNDAPAYVIHFEDGELRAESAESYRRSRGKGLAPVFPHLVEPGQEFNIYRYAGMYYGVHRLDRSYSPSRTDYSNLIRAPSIEEVRLGILAAED